MSASPRSSAPPIPHPNVITLAMLEEAAYRGAMRAIEMSGARTAGLTPRILHRRKGYSAQTIAKGIEHSAGTIYRIESAEMKSLDQNSVEICRKVARFIGENEEFYLQVVQENIDRRWNR